MSELTMGRPRVLPPRGLLFALASQLPLLAASGTPRPSTSELVAGTALIALGCVLNMWAERLF